MSKASRITLLVFLASVAAVAGLLGYMTLRMLDLEREELYAKFDARQQENLRLALWRMDSVIAPIIAQEAARPYFHYLSYYPEQRAFTRVWEPVLPGEVIVPSPLVEGTPPYVRLHFQIGPSGTVYSPQVPLGNDRDLAESEPGGAERVERYERSLTTLSQFVSFDGLSERPGRTRDEAADERPPGAAKRVQRTDGPDSNADVLAQREYGYRKEAAEIASVPAPVTPQTWSKPQVAEQADSAQQSRANERLGAPESRSAIGGADAGDADSLTLDDATGLPPPTDLSTRSTRTGTGARADLAQSRFIPRWRVSPSTKEAELLFWRTVRAENAFTLQGFWLDWPGLRHHLLSRIEDVLPGASIVPAFGIDPEDHAASTRLLASIPAMIVPPPISAPPIRLLTPSHLTLALTWLATLGAIAAVGMSLKASISLGERRGRFVSAVTHELRTPLTTFCLYSQMLADGMVTEEGARAEYLQTLKNEATRLQRIVENVLEFARLGRSSGPVAHPGAVAATTPVATILDQALPTLRMRARQAGMSLEECVQPDALQARVSMSADAASRVLLNLVDNACKYAADAADKTVTLDVGVTQGRVRLTVSDRGPGIAIADRKRVFKAFSRGKLHESSATQGLGLGLSLARAISLQHGGELTLDKGSRPGATFTLELPQIVDRSGL